MGVSILFDRVEVDFVEFRPDPTNPGGATLRAHGRVVSATGASIEREIGGWEGIPAQTRAYVEGALQLLMVQRAALELDMDPETAADMLELRNGQLRLKGQPD
jgi:hypothetical protein